MTALEGGTIHVLGNGIWLGDEAYLDVSGDFGGGTILIGGDYQGNNPEISNANLTFINPEATIIADSLLSGDGGKVIFWGDRACHFWGTASAKGGSVNGDGGLIETSSPQDLQYRGSVDLKAPFGNAGTLLLDPTDITINNTGPFSPTFPQPGASNNYIPNATATLLDSDLEASLVTGNVIVSTAGTAGDAGIITIDGSSSIIWGTPNTLTLTSTDNIEMAAGSVISSINAGNNFTAIVMTSGGNTAGGVGTI